MNENIEMSPIFKRIPLTILIEHIMPYARMPQSRELLRDIRSFSEDIGIIDNMYHSQYNDGVLFNDLMYFVNNRSLSATETNPKYQNILRRHTSLKNASNKDIVHCFHKCFKRPLLAEEVSHRNRLLFGLLTPEERTEFINKYILYE
jgi:hypothetical protein